MSKSLLSVIVGLAALLGLILVLSWPSGGSGSGTPNGSEGENQAGAGGVIAATEEARPPASISVAFTLDRSRVRAITITLPGDEPSTVTRLPGGSWVYAAGDVPERSGWPADGVRALEALGALERVEAVGRAADGPGDDAAIAVFHMGSGPPVRLAFATSAVGGNVRIEGPDGAAVVRAAALSALLEPGLQGWRSSAAMPGVGPGSASRITVSSGEGRLALSRQGGRWFVDSPLSARADAGAADALLRAIAGLRVQEHLDELPVGALRDRDLEIVVERDQRDAGAAANTRRTALRIGGPAPMGVGVRFAQVTLPDGSEHAMAVRAASLPDAAALLEPSVYIDKSPAEIRPDDVQFITVRSLTDSSNQLGYRRTVGEWVRMLSDGGQETLGFGEAQQIGGALSLLSQMPATPMMATDVEFRGFTRLELRDVHGDLASALTVGYAGGNRVAVRDGAVVWAYDLNREAPDLFLLPDPATVEPEPERAAPAGTPRGPGTAK